MKVQRSYNIRLYGNSFKEGTSRYTADRFTDYANMWMGRLFFVRQIPGKENFFFSTAGLGQLANQAQHKASGILRAQRESAKETGNKVNVPFLKHPVAPAKVKKSKVKTFDYWVTTANQWTKKGQVVLPGKSHKALKNALSQGWELSDNCEMFWKNDKCYARLFVSKEVEKALPITQALGCDVGIKHSVCTSDGYLGHGLRRVKETQWRRRAARQKQNHQISSKMKTVIKQLLDKEAKYVIGRSVATSRSLVVESPKHLANLRSGKLQGWARSYFANRCAVLGKEEGVFVLGINPAYSSQTCSECGHRDKESRASRDVFRCTACGFEAQADVNAAVVLAGKGTAILARIAERSGAAVGKSG